MERRRLLRPLAAAAISAAMLWIAFVAGRRIPLLWAADLGFHELGHMLAMPLGTTAHFLAGSTTQVLVPLGLAGYFAWWRRDIVAAGLMLVWAATSAQDASVYIADAPWQRLPLIGGHHDWNFLLSRWQALGAADSIARAVWALGLLAGITGLALILSLVFQPWIASARTSLARRTRRRPTVSPSAKPGDLEVRAPRPPR